MATRHVLEADGSVKQFTIGSMSNDFDVMNRYGVTKATPMIVAKNDRLEMAMSQFPLPAPSA